MKNTWSNLPWSKELDQDEWFRLDGGLKGVLGDANNIGGLLGIRVCNDERCKSDCRSRRDKRRETHRCVAGKRVGGRKSRNIAPFYGTETRIRVNFTASRQRHKRM